MKLKLLFSLIILLSAFASIAQPSNSRTEEYKDGNSKIYGEHATKTTTVTKDGKLNIVVTVEYKTAGGRTMRKTVWRKDLQNNWKRNDTCYDRKGETRSAEEHVVNASGVVISFTSFFMPNAPYSRNEKGQLVNSAGHQVTVDQGIEMEKQINDEINKIETQDIPAFNESQSPCEKQQSCAPTAEVFGGYSFLNTSQDGESESFALGVEVAAVYMLTGRLGVAADFSMHTKKDMELRIMRAFLMGGVQYQLTQLVQQRKALRAYARLLAGVAFDKQKYSFGGDTYKNSATGFAIAAGPAIALPLYNNLMLQLMVDYIYTKFKMQSQSNIRASVGVKLNFGACGTYKKK